MADTNTNPILAKANKAVAEPVNLTFTNDAQVQQAADSFRNTISQHKQVADMQRAKVDADMEAVATSTDSIVASINKEADSKVIAKRAELNTQLSTDLANKAVYEAAGGSEKQTELMQQYKDHSDKVSSLLAQKTDIMDDESGSNWFTSAIKNAFRAIPVDIQLQQAMKEEDHTAMQISNLVAGQAGFMQINERVKATVTRGSLEANLAAMEAGVRTEAHKAKLDALQSNAMAFNRIVSASSAQMANTARLYELERQQQLDPYMIPAQIANAKQTVFEYNSNQELLLNHTNSVQEGQAIVKGAGGYDEPAAIADSLRQGGPEEAKYRKWIEIGKTRVVGATPYAAKAALNMVAPSGDFVPTKGTDLLNLISEQQTAAQLPSKDKGKVTIPVPKNVTEDQAQFDSIATNVMSTYAANASTPGNPYKAPPMEVLSMYMAHRKNKLFDTVVSKTMPQELNEVQLLSLAVDAIKSGQLKGDQAVGDIVEIFEAVADANNVQDGGFKRFGLREQTEYNVPIPVQRSAMEAIQDSPLALLSVINPALSNVAVGAAAKLSAKYEVVDFMDHAEVANIVAKLSMQNKKAPPVNSSNEGTR